NPTPTTWVYKIRPGVTFWDGKPLTAEDVAYSLNRNVDPAAGSYFSFYFSNVASVKATGRDTVTITLKKPDVLLNQAIGPGAGAVGEEAYIKAKGTDYGTPSGGVMCTGPFKFGQWQSGTSLKLDRNDAYWDKTLAPKAAHLDLRFISDESTAINALRGGPGDGQYFYNPPTAHPPTEAS